MNDECTRMDLVQPLVMSSAMLSELSHGLMSKSPPHAQPSPGPLALRVIGRFLDQLREFRRRTHPMLPCPNRAPLVGHIGVWLHVMEPHQPGTSVMAALCSSQD